MGALSRAVRIGGLVAVGVWLGAGPGSAQSGAGPPAAQPAAATSVSGEPASAARSASQTVADAAALKADPDCQPTAVSCAWSQCYPLTSKWTSYSGCVAGACQVKDKACVMDLISDLYDPDRQRSRGAR